MKWFRNLRISAKLLLSFMVIALIAGAMGVYGIKALSEANTKNLVLFENYGISQGYLGYVYGEYEYQRSLLRDIQIEKTIEQAELSREKISASDEKLWVNMQAYEQTCTKPDEKERYADFENKMKAYMDARDEIVEAGVAGDFEGSFALLRSENSALVVKEATAALENAVSSNVELANHLMDEQSANTNTKTYIMIILVAAAVVLAIIFGIVVARIISKPIKALSKTANQIALGDFDFSWMKETQRRSYLGQKDETIMPPLVKTTILLGLVRFSYLFV